MTSKLLLIVGSVISGLHLVVAPPAVGSPPGILLPWETPGMDVGKVALAAKNMDEAWKNLAARFLKNPQYFDDYIQENGGKQTLNAVRLGREIQVGERELTSDIKTLLLQPVLCSVADHVIVGLELGDASRNIVLISRHLTFPRQIWQDISNKNVAGPLISRSLNILYDQVSAEFVASPQAANSAFHLGLSLAKETTREDEGSSHCINMILVEKMAPTFLINREFGNRHLALVRRELGITDKMQRATRRLVLAWDIIGEKRIPLELGLAYRFGESVFGAPITAFQRIKLKLQLEESLNLQGMEPLYEYLLDESGTLKLDDLPQAAKIDRAWIYMDRGRAYGIKMNDRLIHRSGADVIKGHVVGFFGPGLKITSPRGYPIHEGAIVFIRTGQHLTRIGQEFAFDPTVYPTAWPPETTP